MIWKVVALSDQRIFGGARAKFQRHGIVALGAVVCARASFLDA
jgi:hypothetical protein